MTDAEWPNVIKDLTERYGSDPSSVGLLLEFLTVLPEEVTSNHRIPVDNEHYNVRVKSLLSNNAEEVMRLLAMYIQAPGKCFVQTRVNDSGMPKICPLPPALSQASLLQFKARSSLALEAG